jgi:hypothetical protein
LQFAHLGYYTTEQEADDFSVEVLWKMGIDVQALPMRKFENYKKRYHADRDSFIADNGGLSLEDCEKLHDAGWRDERGEYQYIPLGNLHDTHHGGCYRTFNMSREISAHEYSGGSTPEGHNEQWAKVQAWAAQKTQEFSTGPVSDLENVQNLPKPFERGSSGLILD